ncbi:MAG TPA: DUF3106 domain-containing protein [Candidatus Angelobacter sp.]|nr:DUF3106 domain-containing protein [Candidatus Angelobacter sp.]
MIKTRVARLTLSVLLFVTAALANQQQHPGAHGPAPRPNVNNNKNHPKADNKQEHKAGDWLLKNQTLPPDQQEKALENDPGFQKLPPERQAQLKERLRKFNSLPPEERQRAVQRMQFMESLTPQQREQFQQANQQFQGLPENRKLLVRTALRHLRQMDPQGRQQQFQSDQFRNTFSPQEQELLKSLSGISPPENPAQEPPKQ